MSDTSNTQATNTQARSTEWITITIDGKEVQAPKGAMLIEVTDAHNIHVPRFCYHKKLSVAANCRMCLVEVEKAPKPLPACATPVMDGMVVHTRSEAARHSQKAVLEFLLINHPLDCPICDQGGECELQDLAVGYGQDASQYVDSKHVVLDRNIGPLIATELTRCIHCTRCVRFGQEIAGMRELGMTGRGENSMIATFIGDCVNSELSGNVIDVCPVGALTAKPSRFKGRAWELVQHPSIAPHDCIGSNIYVHTLRGKIERVVPRENEAINEVWLSDRDRFSYQGINTADRLSSPMIKHDGQWHEASWDEALQVVADKFRQLAGQGDNAATQSSVEDVDNEAVSNDTPQAATDSPQIAALVSPGATLEEQYLTQKFIRGLGSGNVDFRLRQADFSDQDVAPVMPWLGQTIEQLEQLDAALLIGSNVRKEQPIANLRLRKAVLNNQAKIAFLNPRVFEFNYPVAQNISVCAQDMVAQLAAVAAAVYAVSDTDIPAHLSAVIRQAEVTTTHKQLAQQLAAGKTTSVLLGNLAQMHPQFSALRQLADAIAKATSSTFGYLTDGCNAAGAWLAGAVPHRGAGGRTEGVITGKNLSQLSAEKLAACLLVHIEPDTDAADANRLMAALQATDFVVSISSYQSASLKQLADVLLPAANFTETSGTYVNVEGLWQNFKGILKPAGEARPGWKILRVLANLVELDGFEYLSSAEVASEVRGLCESIELSNSLASTVKLEPPSQANTLHRASDVPIYAEDAIVRRASSLQQTVDAQRLCVCMNAAQIKALALEPGSVVNVKQDENAIHLTLAVDDSIPDNCAWMPLAVEGNAILGSAFAAISIDNVLDECLKQPGTGIG